MVEKITPMSEDFNEWYTDIIQQAQLADYSPVKGTMVIRPYGYSLWEGVQAYLDKKFKETGHENAYFPLFIPNSFIQKEAEHVEGFSPELATVTHAGGKELEDPLVVRPTSETIINYAEFAENAAGVSVVKGIKSANERFAGATTTYSIEAMMKDKKALQAGTSHELGQNFSKAFEIQYSDENNELQHPFQTSWGVSTRLIGMIIMAHGDDKGLQLPPKLAPTQSVLIPIIPNEDSKSVVLETVNKLHEELRESYRMKIDDRDNISPGFKFNEWELKGVPLRIEIGPKDIEKNSVVFSRRDGVDGKNSISINEVSQKLKDNLDDIQSNLLETSKNFRKDNTIHVDSKAELIDTLNSTPGFVTCYWDENTSDEIEIKDLTKATLRCYLLENEGSAKAVNNESVEGKKAIFSKAY